VRALVGQSIIFVTTGTACRYGRGMYNLEPATSALTNLVNGVQDDQLALSTPCSGVTVGDLLDHVNGFSMAFAAAGTKAKLGAAGQAAKPDASNLGSDWRERIPRLVAALGEAWIPSSAWEGMTEAGGNDVPADVAGVIALDEIVVHGWDIAVSSGQSYSCPSDLIQAAYGFVESTVARSPNGSPGLFGPPVTTPKDAPLLDQLIGLTGRDPSWRP
jgi:uncharacterized protein (TIGR03086 family)